MNIGLCKILSRSSARKCIYIYTSLTGGQPNFARCLAVSWAGRLFSGALVRCKIHFTSKSCVRLYWQRYCMALQQRASAKLCGIVQGMELRNFCRGRHLYSAGRPSRWATTHILVSYILDSHIWGTFDQIIPDHAWRKLLSFQMVAAATLNSNNSHISGTIWDIKRNFACKLKWLCWVSWNDEQRQLPKPQKL